MAGKFVPTCRTVGTIVSDPERGVIVDGVVIDQHLLAVLYPDPPPSRGNREPTDGRNVAASIAAWIVEKSVPYRFEWVTAS